MRWSLVLIGVVTLLVGAFILNTALNRADQGEQKADAPKADSKKTAADPSGTPRGTDLAIHDPDEFAWRMFFVICRQALPGKAGEPDPGKPTIRDYDPDKPLVWETWALSSGGRVERHYARPNRSEVFQDRGEKPRPWDKLPRKQPPPKVFESFPAKGIAGLLHAAHLRGKKGPQGNGPLPARDNGTEVRINREGYEHIRDNNLYSIEGLEEIFRLRETIAFPVKAKEIKAIWVRISEKNKPRYHWRTVQAPSGKKETWGLSGLHISTRDLPNWFWCDFEHVDFEGQAELESRDATTRGENPSAGQDGVRKETKGTKWQYYRLRGSQIDFTDAHGRPIVLANSQLERGFQQSASCMTCHSRATVGPASRRPSLPGWQANHLLDFVATVPVLRGPLGSPDPDWYLDEFQEPRYSQTDFIWSMPFRALSTKVEPPGK